MTTTAVTGPAARAVHVWKVYGAGETEVVALRDVSVDLERGRFTAIMGPSGSGKSTLMHTLAGLDSVSSGEVYVGDTRVTGLGDAGLTRLRRNKIGFIFQQFNLLPTLTAEENILLPMSIAGRKPDPEWYRTVIETVRLGDRLGHRPSQLSGGQQQRVACARALVSRPDVIFADEPTGNLDSRSGADVLTFLRDSVQTHGQTIVMVTHDPVAASYADRVLFLADGAVVGEILDPTADAVLDRMRTIDALDESTPGPTPVTGPARESRGTTDPTGRTPHPGQVSGGGYSLGGRHRTEEEPGGTSAGAREPDDPTPRAVAVTAPGARRAIGVGKARTYTATLTSAGSASVVAGYSTTVGAAVSQRPRPRSADTAPPATAPDPTSATGATRPGTKAVEANAETAADSAARATPVEPQGSDAVEDTTRSDAQAAGVATGAAATGEASAGVPAGSEPAGRDRGLTGPEVTDAGAVRTVGGGSLAASSDGSTASGLAGRGGGPGGPEAANTGVARSVEGERRTAGGAGRRKPAGAARQRPAASRPPTGKQRRRASPLQQPDDTGGAPTNAATDDAGGALTNAMTDGTGGAPTETATDGSGEGTEPPAGQPKTVQRKPATDHDPRPPAAA